MSKDRKLKQKIRYLEVKIIDLKDEKEALQVKINSLQGVLEKRLEADQKIMGTWDEEREGYLKMLTDVRTVVVGNALDEGEQKNKGAEAIFQDIVGGLHCLQIEMQRVSITQKTVLNTTEIIQCEHSCFQCRGPAPDMDVEGNLTQVQEELMEKRLRAKCEIQKQNKGIALDCLMFNPKEDFRTIKKGEIDGRGEGSEGSAGSGAGNGNRGVTTHEEGDGEDGDHGRRGIGSLDGPLANGQENHQSAQESGEAPRSPRGPSKTDPKTGHGPDGSTGSLENLEATTEKEEPKIRRVP